MTPTHETGHYDLCVQWLINKLLLTGLKLALDVEKHMQ